MKWKLFKYPIWIFFSLLLMWANFVFADSLGSRLPTYLTLDALDISGNVDYKGYALTNVGGITGNGTYIGFGGEVTSCALSNPGDIVVNQLEVNDCLWANKRIFVLSEGIKYNNNIEANFGSNWDFCIGYDSGSDVFSFGKGVNCQDAANRAMYINKSTNVVIVNDLTIGAKTIYTPSTTQGVMAASGITVSKTIMRVMGATGAINITADPQIAAGSDGQLVYIQGDSDGNTVQLDDGTGLQLEGAVAFVLGKGDIIQFLYDSGDSLWIEVNRSNN